MMVMILEWSSSYRNRRASPKVRLFESLHEPPRQFMKSLYESFSIQEVVDMSRYSLLCLFLLVPAPGYAQSISDFLGTSDTATSRQYSSTAQSFTPQIQGQPAVSPQRLIELERLISNYPAYVSKIGLEQFTPSQKEALNELLSLWLNLGRAEGAQSRRPDAPHRSVTSPEVESSRVTSQVPARPLPSATSASSGYVYRSKVDRDDDDVLFLLNGAIVKVIDGYVGYVGYGKDCILFQQGARTRLWIEGKRTFTCELIRAPVDYSRTISELAYLSSVRADGAILELDDGRMYEVDSYDRFHTSMWLGMSEILLLNDNEIIKLDDGDEPVSVQLIR